MRRRWFWLFSFATLAVLTSLSLYEYSTHVGRGWLRGEAFFEGRPTSWWREAVDHDLKGEQQSHFLALLSKVFPNITGPRSCALIRDPQAVGVLAELAQDKDERVIRFAKHFLDRHREWVEIENDFDCRVDFQFYLALEHLNYAKRIWMDAP